MNGARRHRSAPPAAVLLLATCATAAGAAAAAESTQPTWRGYLEAVQYGDAVNDRAAANQDNRLDLPGSDTAAIFDGTVSLQHGRFQALVEGYARTANQETQALKAYQQYVAATSDDGAWYLRVGKVVPSWGVGQIWNPVRSLTNEARRDLIFPNTAVEGIRLAQVQYVLGADTSITALLLPPRDGEPAGYALRYASNVGDLDYAVSGFASGDDQRRAGLELSWVLGPAAIVAEAAWSNRAQAVRIGPDGQRTTRGNSGILRYVVGGNVALPQDILFSAEYYHDGDAYSRAEFVRFADAGAAALDLLNPVGNGKDTLYAALSQRLLWNSSALSLAVFHNLQSRVSLLQVRASTSLHRQVSLSLGLSHYSEPDGGSQVNLYRNMFDARVRFNF